MLSALQWLQYATASSAQQNPGTPMVQKSDQTACSDAASVHRAENLDIADWIETEAARDPGFDQLDDARNRGLGIVSLDKIEVVLGFRSAKIGNDTLIDEVGIHDDLTLGRLPEYFGEAHHCFSLNGRTAAR